MDRMNIYLDGIGHLLVEYDVDDDNLDVNQVYSNTKIPGKAIKHLLSDEAIETIADQISRALRQWDRQQERDV